MEGLYIINICLRWEYQKQQNCPFFENCIGTIECVYIECINIRSLWKATEDWVRRGHYCHIKISDIEKLFVMKTMIR